MKELNTCTICGTQFAVSKFKSALGPQEFYYCMKCINAQTEPIKLVDAILGVLGSEEFTEKMLNNITVKYLGNLVKLREYIIIHKQKYLK